MNRGNRRVCIRGVIVKDGKIFCQQLRKSSGQPAGFYCTPGGGLDPGEALIDGLQREIIEETGVEPKIGRLLFVQQYSDGSIDERGFGEQLEFFFHIENADDFENIDGSASHYDEEIYDCGFFDPKSTNLLPDFLQTIDLQAHISGQEPPYIYTEFKKA